MSDYCWSRRVRMLAVVIGTTLLTACPVRAQDNPPQRTAPQGGAKLPGADDPQGGKPLPEWQLPTWRHAVLAARVEQADETLGATLQPVGDALRAQLDLPAGQGLLIASLRDESPTAQAGLKQNDILLALADKPLAAAEDLTKHLKAAGEAPLSLKILRAGKPITIQVRPVYRVTLGPVAGQKTEYFIGVSLEPANDALRAQLALPEGQGVLVTDVVNDSPAEKAGVKKYDIVVELKGIPIDSPATLTAQIQAAQDKPTALRLLRSGRPVKISITPAVRKVEASPSEDALRLWVLDQQPRLFTPYYFDYLGARRRVDVNAQAATPDLVQRLDRVEKELTALRRIEALEKELKALHAAVEKVSESLKGGKATKRD